MLGKLFSVRDGLKLPALWRWLLTLAGCLLTGLGLALACRLIDSQSLRQTLAAVTQGSLWFTALFLALACAVFALLTHSLFIGSAVTALLSVLLTFVNYFKVLITSVPLSLGDFTLIGQVGNIATLNASAITFGRNSILAGMGWYCGWPWCAFSPSRCACAGAGPWQGPREPRWPLPWCFG